MNMLKTGMLLAAMTALFLAAGYLLGGQSGMQMALIFALGTNFFAWWFSDKMLLGMYGAKELPQGHAIHQITAELARKAGLPMPRVYMLESAQPNAFATGRNPQNGAVAVSSGLVQTLNRAELRGVIAHELAHIKNRDTLIMTITATIAGALGMLANFFMFFGGGHRRDNPLGALGGIVVMILAPIAATLVQLAISRTREYAADAGGAEISGDPLALASALEKISGYAARVDNHVAERNPATAHLFIINPLHARASDGLFSTHPNPHNRIARLREMAGRFNVSSHAASRRATGPWG